MDERIKIGIAQALKSARKGKGLTQAELGDRIGRTAEALSNIERGEAVPSVETLVALSGELGLRLSDFFPDLGGNDEVSPRRLRLEVEAVEIIRKLPEKSLVAAIDQLNALAKLSA